MIDKIFNEDCLEGMKRIPDGSVDMVLADLPYGSSDNPWDIKLPLDKVWEQYLRVCKHNAAIVLFSQLPFGAELIMSQPKLFRYEWIWEKTLPVGFLNANRMPLRCHENILVFYRKLPTYNPQWGKGKPYFGWKKCVKSLNKPIGGSYSHTTLKTVPYDSDGRRYPRDVIKFTDAKTLYRENIHHSTEKPVALLEYLIKTYTNEGETVLDNCIGSGSTAVACVNTGRRFVGFETEQKYFEIANRRVDDARIAKTDNQTMC